MLALLQFPGRHVISKPSVPHMVFNLGDSVAEATNFCLEKHLELLETQLEGDNPIYKYIVCSCGEGKERLVARLPKSCFIGVSRMSFANREDKKTAGKQKLAIWQRSKRKRLTPNKSEIN